ncbi:DUF4349 domain-containing protein [Lyngbya aestuarii]|uniref:DUF4349 domain-containing protein n=1 Tax=Lyngbya aestuarii TaxID=118322 RepID=UPI00403E0E2D
MNRSHHSLIKPALFLTPLLGSILLVGCNSASEMQLQQEKAQLSAPLTADAPVAEPANVAKVATPNSEPVPQSRPQLVKTADISLVVNSIDDTLQEASKIVKQQQGDLLGLQDNKPQDSNRRHTASMRIRIPQDKLETTLEALATLGTVEYRNLTAEDVTNQLVDVQARLRNLRKTESSLLQIMERSGSVGDVLKVAQELSKVRESIEQIDAQLKNLTNQVAYSTINLQLEASVFTTTNQAPLGTKVNDTWQNATQSVGEFTSDLLRLTIWLVAYSPYLLVLGAITWFAYIQLKKQPPQTKTQTSSDAKLSSD